MTLHVPGVGAVQIEWHSSPDHGTGRAGLQPIAIVHHRAVSSSLAGIVKTLSTSDSRPVSATFAVGHEDGKPKVVQLVDLSDTAWCNGDCQQRVYPSEASNWDRWYGHRAHNERTISIEHEDQGGSNDPKKKGIVTDDLVRTSIALDRVLLSGDLAAIRAAGIRCREAATARALGKIKPGPRTLITHHDIAGKLKPSCWLPWKADKTGFPRDRYVAELSAPPAPQEADMPPLSAYIPGQIATVKGTANIRSKPEITAASLLRTVPEDRTESWTVTGWVKGAVDPDGGSDQWLARWADGRWEYTAKSNVSAGPAAPTGDCTAAIKAATDPLERRIGSMKATVAAAASDVANA